MSKRLQLALLIAALLAGFWLRWDGLEWGRSTGAQFHPDEPRFVEQAEALDRDLPLRKSYVFGFGQAIRAVHAIIPSADYGIIGRSISLTSGMLLCLVVFAVARQLELRAPAATFAAALTSLNTMCVIHSHFGTADMTYVLFLYLFALAVLRGWRLIAAVVTGVAMATKFGMILLPSLLWLVCSPAFRRNPERLKAVLQAILLLLIAGFVFVAAQGFTFDGESIRMISLSVKQDNIGGFEHQKWQNIITYFGVAIRSLGIPVFIFAVIALVRTRWGALRRDTPVAVWIAFLPLAIHAIGLLAINTAFPRHILALLPLLLIAAAAGIEKLPRLRAPAAALAIGWSALLAWSDQYCFASYCDPREQTWMNLKGGRPLDYVWADPSFARSMSRTYRNGVDAPSKAVLVVLSESWVWRFERSEINPLRAPNERKLYHATPADFRWYSDFKAAVARGTWTQIHESRPPKILPEQILYEAAWGSFEKFAGRCAMYGRVPANLPVTGNTAP